MKSCSHCKISKPSSDFGSNRSQKDGLAHRCKDCSKYLAKKWRTNNQQKVRDMDSRWRANNKAKVRQSNLDTKLKTRYGISREQFLEMSKNQSGRCAICNKEAKLVVDHDHLTGKVRGLLCKSCNIAIGLFKDSAFVLRCAAQYVVSNGK